MIEKTISAHTAEGLRCAEYLAKFIDSTSPHQGDFIASFHEWLGQQQEIAVKSYGWQIIVQLQARLAAADMKDALRVKQWEDLFPLSDSYYKADIGGGNV